MNIRIFKIASFALLLMATFNMSAQDFQGKAVYQSKTTIDLSQMGGGQMSPDRQKMVAERMKSMLEKTYVLSFNRAESIYKEEEKLDAPGQGGGRWGAMMGSFTGGPQYKDVKNGNIIQEQEFFGKQFLVKDSLQKLEWKMENESKQIGEYTVFKATALKEVDEMDFMNWRRRANNNSEEAKKNSDSTSTTPLDEVEVPKEILITAWYAPQIPVNQGPSEYWGLPGLILEVNAGRTTILCTKIILNPEDKDEIKEPKKGEEVSRTQYNKIMKDKMQEMREMYRGRGGRGGSRSN